MAFPDETKPRAPVRVWKSAWFGLLLLPLVLALACGGAGNVRPDPIAGADATPALGDAPRPASAAHEGGDASVSEPMGTDGNPSIANLAAGDGSSASDPTVAADRGGSLVTEPGVPEDPTRTWAAAPRVDPGRADDVTDDARLAPDNPPEEGPSDARQVSENDISALARGNSDFAFDLFRELSASGGNLFFSPHSISTSLAMTCAGARGDTETAMADTLRFSLPRERLHRAVDALGRDIAERSGGDAKARFRLNVANAVWAQDGHPFLDSYLDLMKDNYDAEVGLAGFAGDPFGSRSRINRWVSDETEGKIEDLIPPGLIDGLTRMVLVNAVYFNAGWLYPFDEHLTTRELFHLLDGGAVSVDMMRVTEYLTYGAGDGYQVVGLPYVGGEVSMAVLLPDQGRFREVEERLDAGFVDQALSRVAERYVALELPRFAFDAAFRLGDTLKAMGMSAAFDPRTADFSGMDGRSCARGDDGCLHIADVVHQAFVSVDEAGAEAAAATGVVMQTESAKPRPVAVRVDRPFIFLIRDHATGAYLFLGRVTEP